MILKGDRKRVDYQYLFIDADDTLLDFARAADSAFRRTLEIYHIDFSGEVLKNFIDINIECWINLELDRIEDKQIQTNWHSLYQQCNVVRFYQLKEKMRLDYIVEDVSTCYLQEFSKQTDLIDAALDILKDLSQKCKVCVITNGLVSVQGNRLVDLRPYVSRVFISEAIGYVKPAPESFEYILRELNVNDTSKCLVVGDSISSDILGGANSGMDTCWYNPNHKGNRTRIEPTYEINHLGELLNIVK